MCATYIMRVCCCVIPNDTLMILLYYFDLKLISSIGIHIVHILILIKYTRFVNMFITTIMLPYLFVVIILL